jgi:hypothetical protein
MTEYQSIYPCGAIRADFNGPDNAVTITITDLRAAGPRGEGIVVSPGRKKYTSYDAAAEAALVMVSKMTSHTVEELKSGEFYQTSHY